MPTLPTVYSRRDSRWWWYSMYTDKGRIQRSLTFLGLSREKYPDKGKVLDRLLEHVGLQRESPAPEPETETLARVLEGDIRP